MNTHYSGLTNVNICQISFLKKLKHERDYGSPDGSPQPRFPSSQGGPLPNSGAKSSLRLYTFTYVHVHT